MDAGDGGAFRCAGGASAGQPHGARVERVRRRRASQRRAPSGPRRAWVAGTCPRHCMLAASIPHLVETSRDPPAAIFLRTQPTWSQSIPRDVGAAGWLAKGDPGANPPSRRLWCVWERSWSFWSRACPHFHRTDSTLTRHVGATHTQPDSLPMSPASARYVTAIREAATEADGDLLLAHFYVRFVFFTLGVGPSASATSSDTRRIWRGSSVFNSLTPLPRLRYFADLYGGSMLGKPTQWALFLDGT